MLPKDFVNKKMIEILRSARKKLPKKDWKDIWSCVNEVVEREISWQNGEIKQRVISSLYRFLGSFSPLGFANFSIYRNGYFYCHDKSINVNRDDSNVYYITQTIEAAQTIRRAIINQAINVLERV